jgi:hypothetical protein
MQGFQHEGASRWCKSGGIVIGRFPNRFGNSLRVQFFYQHAHSSDHGIADGTHRRERIQMSSRVQDLAAMQNMQYDEFIGEMRKRGCSEPTAAKIWRGDYEDFEHFEDNDMYLSNLRKAAFVLRVSTGTLLPK